MSDNPLLTDPRITPVALSGVGATALPAVQWGDSRDLSFNGSGGTAVRAGPFVTTCLRLGYVGTGSVRIALGDASVVAGPTSTLFGGGTCFEHIAIASGSYVSAVSNDALTGILNITQTL